MIMTLLFENGILNFVFTLSQLPVIAF